MSTAEETANPVQRTVRQTHRHRDLSEQHQPRTFPTFCAGPFARGDLFWTKEVR